MAAVSPLPVPLLSVPVLSVPLAGVLPRRVRQFAQLDAAQQAALRGAADQGVRGSFDRPQEQRARPETAQEVPRAEPCRVDGEEVERAVDDEPEDVRPFEGDAAQAGAVDRRAEGAQGRHDRVGGAAAVPYAGGVGGRLGKRHLSAP